VRTCTGALPYRDGVLRDAADTFPEGYSVCLDYETLA